MEADSPAHYAGLKAGDRIIEVEYLDSVSVHMYKVHLMSTHVLSTHVHMYAVQMYRV